MYSGKPRFQDKLSSGNNFPHEDSEETSTNQNVCVLWGKGEKGIDRYCWYMPASIFYGQLTK